MQIYIYIYNGRFRRKKTFDSVAWSFIEKSLSRFKCGKDISGDHPEFSDKVTKEVVSMDNEMIVIGGDRNIAFNPKIDTNQPTNVY